MVIKSSGEIAPLGKYSTDFEWRLNLKVFFKTLIIQLER